MNKHSPEPTPSQPLAKKTARNHKFIPNMSQLQKAVKDLPDPETSDSEEYAAHLVVNGKPKTIDFIRKTISRGSSVTYRWIYEGKILIRKRDVATT